MNIVTDGFDPAGTGQAPAFLSVMLPSLVALTLAGTHPIRQITLGTLREACRGSVGVVGCPLMFGDLDAFAVIETLQGAGFGGTLVVVAPPLPDPSMVEREVRAAARDITLRFVSA